MERKKRSGRPRTTRNEETVEELITSQEQEDKPHSHLTPRQIEESEGISRSSVVCIVKNKEINNFKRSKTPAMNEGTRKRCVERAVTFRGQSFYCRSDVNFRT